MRHTPDQLAQLFRRAAGAASAAALSSEGDVRLVLDAVEDVNFFASQYMAAVNSLGDPPPVDVFIAPVLERFRRVTRGLRRVPDDKSSSQLYVLGALEHATRRPTIGGDVSFVTDAATVVSRKSPATQDGARLAAAALLAWASKGGAGNQKWDVINEFLDAYGLAASGLAKGRRTTTYKHPLRDLWTSRPGTARAAAREKRRLNAK